MPKNLGEDTFPDSVGHFGAHWQAVRRCRRGASTPGAARLVLFIDCHEKCEAWRMLSLVLTIKYQIHNLSDLVRKLC